MTAPAGIPDRARGGLLLVDKPAGATSFAVVDAVRRALVRTYPGLASRGRTRGGPRPPRFKCGHAGTLDPLATGLLVVLVGRGSRLANFLLGLDKTYAATVRLGSATDSLDADGEVVATAPPPASVEAVTAVLDRFRGAIRQVPPVISAIKRDGRPLHRLARAGQDVPPPAPREVRIDRLDLVGSRWDGDAPEVDLEIACGSGTYIRSLARDIAAAAGSLGHVAALRRLAVGPFAVSDAVQGVMELDGTELAARLQPLASALPHVPKLVLDPEETARVRAGGQPEPSWLERLDGEPVACGRSGRLFRLLDEGGELVAVGRLDDATGAPRLALGIPGGGDPAGADTGEAT